MPANCASVEPRCSTHLTQRSPLSRRAVFSYGLAKASRVASELYKTRLGESRGPVLSTGVEVPGSKCLNNISSRLNEFTQFRGRSHV